MIPKQKELRLIPVNIIQEIRLAEDIARQRVQSNQRAGVVEQKFSSRTSLEINVSGMYGEIAVSKFLNIPFDTTIHPRHGGEDLRWGDFLIDVKCPLEEGLNLIVKDRKRLEDTNIYVLSEGKPHIIFLVGFYPSELVFDDRKLRLDKRGNRYYLIHRCDLLSFEDAFVEEYYKRFPGMREFEKKEKYEVWETNSIFS